MANANDLTFGVEIETTLPDNVPIIIGGYHRGIQVPELPAGWKAERDGSIDPSRGYKAVEIVSPILQGADGMRQLLFVLAWLRSKGAKVNRSCGLHVHVGVNATRTDELGRIVNMAARFERGLYAVTGTHTRELGYNGHRFCNPISDASCFKAAYKADEKIHDRIPAHRYFTLNLANLAEGTRPTVEFRVFAGTLSTKKAVGYVRLALGIVEKAVASKRAVAWDLGKNAVEARRYPATAAGKWGAIKLIYALGWKKGEVTTEFGAIDGVEGMPTTAEIVAELYRLADKYDAGSETEAA